MSFSWDDLPYWQSGEWQVVEERLNDLDANGTLYCPRRELIFSALDETPYENLKVMFVGQDPYPGYDDACGLAFSVPPTHKKFPPTLKVIFQEYQDDLHYPEPTAGDLLKWAKEGVLLWNAIPTCLPGKSMSHHHWIEWHDLTKAIIEEACKRHIVFVFVGSVARSFAKYVNRDDNHVFELAHPSPRNVFNPKVKNPFQGSRIFSSVNGKLNEQGLGPVDWRLK